jgi:hypothetical protein
MAVGIVLVAVGWETIVVGVVGIIAAVVGFLGGAGVALYSLITTMSSAKSDLQGALSGGATSWPTFAVSL